VFTSVYFARAFFAPSYFPGAGTPTPTPTPTTAAPTHVQVKVHKSGNVSHVHLREG
jgi:hypothetical protein